MQEQIDRLRRISESLDGDWTADALYEIADELEAIMNQEPFGYAIKTDMSEQLVLFDKPVEQIERFPGWSQKAVHVLELLK